MKAKNITLFLALSALAACSSDVEKESADGDGHDHHDHELMTTVELVFSPQSGGDDLVFAFADIEGAGAPEIDTVQLSVGESYDLSVFFLNELEVPAEDVTPEIADEDNEHQVFFTGSAVDGPATGDNPGAIFEHDYADEDRAGLPIGLDNTATVLQAGTGELTVTLRHMPLESGQSIKTPDLAGQVAADGDFRSVGGANDVQVDFPVEAM